MSRVRISSAVVLMALFCAGLLGVLFPGTSQARPKQPPAGHTVGTAAPAPPRIRSVPQGRPRNAPKFTPGQRRAVVQAPTIDARILVIAADGSEPSLPAIRQVLDYQGTPYSVRLAAANPNSLVANQLFSGSHGFYNGIILTTGNLAYTPDGGTTWLSALSQAEWQTLWDYETAFGVRQATWYTFPTPDYGFGSASAVSTSVTPLAATLTPAGQAVFSYLNPANPLSIVNAYTYLAPAADSTTTPLLTDGRGNALAAVRTYPDGRQNLALTFDSNPYLVHTLAVSYGVINWVTKGLFLGERHVYVGAQVDDVFIPDDVWTTTTPCGTNLDTNPSGVEFRMKGSDMLAVVAWQTRWQLRPTTRALRLDLAFNGEGFAEASNRDSLVAATRLFKGEFKWISHTYDHLLLNDVDYATALAEIQQNDTVARQIPLPSYTRANMVTPEISGLFNPQFLQAAAGQGIRYLVSDTSKPVDPNALPNTGTYSAFQPSILMIPRRANNLFYNVTRPAEWVAEYNCLYHGFWGRDLTVNEIMDKESDLLLQYLLKGEMDPWMFHQTNLRAYDGMHTLLGDLIDRALDKYNRIYNLPILSPTMDALGQQVADRMRFYQAGVTASIVPGQSITLTAQQPVTVPVTGLRITGSESYGGQYIAHVKLNAGQSITISLR